MPTSPPTHPPTQFLSCAEKHWERDRNHPDLAAGHNQLARVLRELGNVDEALKHAKEAVRMYKVVDGEQPSREAFNSRMCLAQVRSPQFP